MPNKEYSTLTRFPEIGEKCLCFGYKTFCCKEDMDEKPEWHEVIFQYSISYRLVDEFPADIEDSLLAAYEMSEWWEIIDDQESQPAHVIGVTKWKKKD